MLLPVADRAELEKRFRSFAVIHDTQVERGAKACRSLVKCERGSRGSRGEHVVLDRLRGAAERRGLREVVGEACEIRTSCLCRRPLERLGDAEVQLRAPKGRQAVVQRPAYELVGESEREGSPGHLLHHAGTHRLVERRRKRRLGKHVGLAQHVELELGTGNGREPQQIPCLGRQTRESLADDLANTLGRGKLGEGAPHQRRRSVDLDRPRLDQGSPELAQEKRVALGEIADAGRELREGDLPGGARGATHEFLDLVAREAVEPEPNDVICTAEVGERVGQLCGHLRFGVAECRHQEHPGVGGRPREMAQEEQRRAVCPVPILDDEEQRLTTPDAREEIGDGCVETVALRVLVGDDRVREVIDPGRKIREEPRKLPAGISEIRVECRRVDMANEIVERFDERPVRRPEDRITRAVEHQRAFSSGFVRELTDEPALAGTRLATDERDAAPLTVRRWHERSQRRKLTGPPDEREGRNQSECAGKLRRGHSQS